MTTEKYSPENYEAISLIINGCKDSIKSALAVFAVCTAIPVALTFMPALEEFPPIAFMPIAFAILAFFYFLIKLSHLLYYKKAFKEGTKQIIEGTITEKKEYHTKRSANYLVKVDGVSYPIDVTSFTHLKAGDIIRIERCYYSDTIFSVNKTGSVVDEDSQETDEIPGDDAAVRLKKLESLREQNLITEEEYQEKRRQIIDNI